MSDRVTVTCFAQGGVCEGFPCRTCGFGKDETEKFCMAIAHWTRVEKERAALAAKLAAAEAENARMQDQYDEVLHINERLRAGFVEMEPGVWERPAKPVGERDLTALCAELVDALEQEQDWPGQFNSLITRARAAIGES